MTSSTLSRTVPLLYQGRTNNCGPYATAMALSFYRREVVDPSEVASAIRWYRVPFLGATLPPGVLMGIVAGGQHYRTGFLGKINDLKHHIDCDRPVIVLVHPSDLRRCHWYDLHYRVVVGYRDAPTLPGGGVLFFNCSSARRSVTPGGVGNVTVDYATFERQWRVWGVISWYAAVLP